MQLARHAVAALRGHALPSRSTLSTANMLIFWRWRPHSKTGKACKTSVANSPAKPPALPPKEGTPYNLYHGTLEARPVTPTTSKIVYTLFFDNSMLPDDAARAADKERRRTRFMQALQNMKTLVEGGKLN